MLKNYVKVAIRNLLKNRSFSFINIFGLALSMSVCLVLIMLIADQKNNDAYNTNKDRIYRVTHDRLDDDELITLMATAPLPIAERLVNDYSDTEKTVRIRGGFGNHWVGVENNVNIPIAGFFADAEFINLFQYKLLAGNPSTALIQPNSVVLKEETAQKLYGTNEVIGRIITVGELGDYIVTGVLKDNGEQSHIKFEAIASLSSLERLEEQDSLLTSSVNNWKNRSNGWVYIQLKEGVKPATVEDHLAAINKKEYAELEDYQHQFGLQALTKISPGPLMGNDIGPGLPLIFVYFLSALAFVVMLSAAFNYMNLSIARALTRAKEVGIRKVSGANKSQLVLQFLTEAIILSLLALAISHVLLFFLKPAFSQLHFSQLLQWNLRQDSTVFMYSVIFSLIVGGLAGIVPALTLSSFQPSKVLKDLSSIKLFSKLGLRKFLVVGQFSLSLIFIISATLVFNQLKLMVGADFGFKTADIINVRLNDTSYKQFRTELEKYPQIVEVTAASHIPAAGSTTSTKLVKTWEDPIEIEVPYFTVDENYISSLGLTLVSGSNFQFLDPDANEIIINEKALESFELENAHAAIGQYLVNTYDSTELKIIGVLKNYTHQMLIQDLAPMMLIYNPEKANIAMVTIQPNQKNEGLAIIEKAYALVNPELKLDHTVFADELVFYYDLLFGDIVSIIGLATVLALVIACLGLLGMATYTIETKTKEVGIRKVLGASSKQLILQLSKGFMGILLISIVIALPLAYFINNLWLQEFAFRVSITFGVLSFGVLTLVILGLITIGSQTYRATIINPIDHLRNE